MGNPVSDALLDNMQNRLRIQYSPAQRELYKEIGGRPDLDMEYTVFGEIVEGLEIVDQIAAVSVDPANRPFDDIPMTIRLK